MNIEETRAKLDRVRRNHSFGHKGSRRDIMAAADAYALAVLEEARSKADIDVIGSYHKRRVRLGKLRRRIEMMQ